MLNQENRFRIKNQFNRIIEQFDVIANNLYLNFSIVF